MLGWCMCKTDDFNIMNVSAIMEILVFFHAWTLVINLFTLPLIEAQSNCTTGAESLDESARLLLRWAESRVN